MVVTGSATVASGDDGVVLIGVLFLRGVCFVRGETGAFGFGGVFMTVGEPACLCGGCAVTIDSVPLGGAPEAGDLITGLGSGATETVTLLIETFGTVDEMGAADSFAVARFGTGFDCDVIACGCGDVISGLGGFGAAFRRAWAAEGKGCDGFIWAVAFVCG